jgi:hypothetical protein
MFILMRSGTFFKCLFCMFTLSFQCAVKFTDSKVRDINYLAVR